MSRYEVTVAQWRVVTKLPKIDGDLTSDTGKVYRSSCVAAQIYDLTLWNSISRRDYRPVFRGMSILSNRTIITSK